MRIIDKLLAYFGYVRKVQVTRNDENVPKEYSLAPISSFQLTGRSTELTFTSLRTAELPATAIRIPMGPRQKEDLYNALSVSAGTAATGAQAGMLQGLYRATADPGTLMKLSGGGVGSAVIENGKIVGQAGFQAVTAAAAPLIVFQAMSIITGQYYLNTINKQLDGLKLGIDKLIRKAESENKGKLDSAICLIRQLDKQSSFTNDDILLVRQVQMSIQSMYFNYLEQMKIIADNNSLESMFQDGFFTNKAVKQTLDKLNGEDFGYLTLMANSCYQVLQLLDALYFRMLTTVYDPSPATVDKLNAYIYSCSIEELPEHIETYNDVVSKVSEYIDSKTSESVFHENSIKEKKENFNKQVAECRERMDNEEIFEYKRKLNEQFSNKRQIYYMINKNGEAEAFIES